MSNTNPIPFIDLITLHKELRKELVDVFNSALAKAGFIGGPAVESFEQEFAAYCEVTECVGVGSGTDALRFALMAVGIREGEIVITVPNSFIATTEAISQAGARPVFVDIEERTYNLDPRKLQEYLEGECYRHGETGFLMDRKLEKRVAAVVPVHLYGQTADMDSIMALAEQYGLLVIEDACQSHGAEYFSRKDGRWKKAGSMGVAAAFSFYPGKNLGACGEGGAVTTNDREVGRKIRMLRDHGQAYKYYHDFEGYNGRLDAIQAGILSAKLRHLTEWNEQRRKCAAEYQRLFANTHLEIVLPHEPSWAKAVYHLFVVRVAAPLDLQRHLSEAQIGTGIHYPVPLHLQKAYQGLGYRQGDFPVTERVANEILSLPMFPGLTSEQQAKIANRLVAFLPSNPCELVAAAAEQGC